ncbi:ATP synthase protein I [Geomicrobium halophilum]|uniref:ATP synthase protein I n=1 Tax=Geomicrobium halophilum TaxID=549000 RepID=A0A841Q064_9BACL|nr:ATP synthase subunit I [Geomicrobium halophilum]MBB6450465.1 ATP synthase protein I [Geomicrobium halophilum]
MPSLQQRMKLYYWMMAFIAFVSGCMYFLTPYESIFLGLLLGSFACLMSFMSVYIKALVIGGAADKQPSGMIPYLITALGLVLRYATIAVAVAIALFFPETFHLWAVLIGYASLYLYILVDMFLQLKKER